MQQLKSMFDRSKTAVATGVATATIAVLSSPAAMAAGDITDMTTAATTELGPVKVGMVTVGVVLVGVAALGFAIYKIISMSGGRK